MAEEPTGARLRDRHGERALDEQTADDRLERVLVAPVAVRAERGPHRGLDRVELAERGLA